MYKANGMNYKRYVFRLATIILTVIAISAVTAANIYAENFFEYYFIPGESEDKESGTTEDIASFLDELPPEIKNELPENILEEDLPGIAEEAEALTGFPYLWNKITDIFGDILFPSLKSATVILGIILAGAVLRALKNSMESKGAAVVADAVINLGMGIMLMGTQLVVTDTLAQFKEMICGLMNGMIPLIGGIFAASGNGGTAAVQSGGIMMLVTLCQNIFSNILLPSVRICLAFGVIGAVFPDLGVKSISSAFRNITVTLMTSIMTLFSFMLSLQNSVAQSADTFGTKSIKFALGNLVPLIGGAVSDSLGTIGGSLGLLKSAGGSVAIAVIIILLAPTMITLICNRLVLFVCKAVAGMLNCNSEEELLGDMGSVSSMMIAFAASVSVAFIYSLTLFTKATLAVSS